jgi:aspartate/methionine/tyrosine aminotransferase
MKFPSVLPLLLLISKDANIEAFSPTIMTPSTSTKLSASTESESNPIAINPIVKNVKVSATVQIFSNVKQMQAEGIEVTSLCVGEPDFPPPQAVLDAASKAILDCDTRYTAVTGTAALRQAIADDLLTRKGITYDPNTEIVVGNGAKQCVYQGVLATAGPGDTVIIPAPYWPSYPEMVALAGANSVILDTKEEDGYLITPEALRSCLEETKDQNVKLMILCNPSNPTGGVHNRKRLEELAAVLEDYPQIAILADEIYERLVYNDSEEDAHVSFASISPEMYQRTMTINGFSKAYAMTGMRLGYMAAPQPLAKAATTIQSQLTSCAGSISQAAGVAALRDVKEEEMEKNVAIMRAKRDYVIDRLSKMDRVNLAVPPTGAFYVLPDVSTYYNGDDTQLCLDLLEKKRLALVPGSSFGAPGTVRISYATSVEELEIAMNKLQDFLEES